MHRVVVLGAGYAGLPAVNRIAKQTYRDEVELVLVSTHDQFVERPRLHQLATGQTRPNLPLSDFLRPGIDLRVGRVQRIDVAGRALHFGDTGQPWSLRYDTLLYAAGSTIDLQVPGADVHAHSVATPEGARQIADRLIQDSTARVVVCGGGLTGLELASEFADSYPALEVTLVTRGELGDWLSPRARDYVREAMDDLGVRILDRTAISRVQPHHVETTGEDVPFDLCVWAGGFVVPQLAAAAGIQVDSAGRVVTDSTLRSVSHQDVYAIGDAAAVPGPWGSALAMGCRTGGFTGPTAADGIVARLSGRAAPTFKFRYIHECISLGRQRHVIQYVGKGGEAISRTLRGRKAKLYKNLVLDAGRWTGKHPGPYRPVRRRHILPASRTSVSADTLTRHIS
jgi:NADH dehydrogenase